MQIEWVGGESPIEIWQILYLLFSYIGGALLICYLWKTDKTMKREGEYGMHCFLSGFAFVCSPFLILFAVPIVVPIYIFYGIGKFLSGGKK